MKKTFLFLSLFLLSFAFSKTTLAHCEVPCGIFHDELRVKLIKEHIQTIEKSMIQIVKLQGAEVINYNQLVRWIITKEDHAKLIQEVAEQYFLSQRVKFADSADEEKYEKYITQLSTLHQLIVFAMKSKQSTNLENVEKMKKALADFEDAYFDEHKH